MGDRNCENCGGNRASHREDMRVFGGSEMQTSGILSDAAGAAKDTFDKGVDLADWAVGDTNEAIVNTFDDEPGGGVIEGFGSATQELIGGAKSLVGLGDTEEPVAHTMSEPPEEDSKSFERKGTPVTDAEREEKESKSEEEPEGPDMKKIAMAGAGVAIAGLALSKSSDANNNSRTNRR